jgi:hypothetical protein
MKIIITLVAAFALSACGPKAKKQTTPDNKTGTTETKPPDGTGGQTYGGATQPAAGSAAAPHDPCAGM